MHRHTNHVHLVTDIFLTTRTTSNEKEKKQGKDVSLSEVASYWSHFVSPPTDMWHHERQLVNHREGAD